MRRSTSTLAIDYTDAFLLLDTMADFQLSERWSPARWRGLFARTGVLSFAQIVEECGLNPFVGEPPGPPFDTAIREQGSRGLSLVGDIRSEDHGHTWFVQGVPVERLMVEALIPGADKYCHQLGEPPQTGWRRFTIIEKAWATERARVAVINTHRLEDGSFERYEIEGENLLRRGFWRPDDT